MIPKDIRPYFMELVLPYIEKTVFVDVIKNLEMGILS